ncbi:LytR/AlgR family response regulator transcription factor [Maricaulis sp.]|uniref:LytR/AlgR family response regulator transcription factor n=1 Tax=Maricaulis sp. TaxID=1486257 RepID=UPI003A9410C7
MMKVLIVDDEPLAVAHLEHLLASMKGITVVATAKNGLAALHAFDAKKPDLVLVDIDMPGMDGLSLARELGTRGAPQVIFVTAFDQFAPQAFDVEATDYVLKPIDPDRLSEALERVRQRLLVAPILSAVRNAARELDPAPVPGDEASTPGRFYWARSGNRSQRIAMTDVMRIEACKDYVFIHTRHEKLMVRATMASLEKEFAGTPIRRVHRSHMVNLQEISEVVSDGHSCTVNLADGAEIPVGRHYRAQLGAMREPG